MTDKEVKNYTIDDIYSMDNFDSLSREQVIKYVNVLNENSFDNVDGKVAYDKLIDILISRCHLDLGRLPKPYDYMSSGEDDEDEYGEWSAKIDPNEMENIVCDYLLYESEGLTRYFLLYCSDVDKIKEVLDKEFEKDEVRFFAGLYHNRIHVFEDVDGEEVMLPGLPKSMRDHPYIQILSHPTSYSRAVKAHILPVISPGDSPITPKEHIVSMIPRTRQHTVEQKVKILIYNTTTFHYQHQDKTLSDVISEKAKYTPNPDFLIKFMSMPVLHKYLTGLEDISRDTVKALDFTYTMFDREHYDNIIIWSSCHVGYVRYIIDKVITTNHIDEVILHTQDYDMNPERMKWLTKHDLVNNEFFRSLYESKYTSNGGRHRLKGLEALGYYFKLKDL